MSDLLVPLYRLPPRGEAEAAVRAQNLVLRRANTFEKTPVQEFIRAHFTAGWADETGAAFARQPVTCFVAIDNQEVVGFAAYEATRKAFFGPTGVAPAYRGRGIGKALLLACLWGLHDLDYAYGIIGAAGPTEFYRTTVGAIEIPDSTPGIYTDLLRRS